MSLRPPMRTVTLAADANVFTIPKDFQFDSTVAAVNLPADQTDWGHDNLGLKALHQKGVLGDGVVVAVLDTGTDIDHSDLVNRRHRGGALDQDYVGEGGVDDGNSHGSHCAGIVLAEMNGTGVRGAAPKATLITKKVLSAGGSGGSAGIAAAIRKAADDGADIISMSLGSSYPDSGTEAAVNYAVSKGVWVVAAAGNSGPGAIDYPGAYANCLSVGATDQNNRRAGFSSTNRFVDVAAPGVQILSCLPGNRWGRMSGTSMATPYVAGCLALARGELKRLGLPVPDQRAMMQAVADTATDLGSTGRDDEYGAGLINTAKLIEKLVGSTPVPPPVPPTPVPPVPPAPKKYAFVGKQDGFFGGPITGVMTEVIKPDPVGEWLVSSCFVVSRDVPSVRGPLGWIDKVRKIIEFVRVISDLLDKLESPAAAALTAEEEVVKAGLVGAQVSIDDLQKWLPLILKNIGIAAPIILDGIAAGKKPFAILLEVIAALSLSGVSP